jgi:hypothetical protein
MQSHAVGVNLVVENSHYGVTGADARPWVNL